MARLDDGALRAAPVDTCSCCGGELPAPHGSRQLDLLDPYLVRRDAMCPGHLRVDSTGTVLGCGAWTSEAYEGPSDRDDDRWERD